MRFLDFKAAKHIARLSISSRGQQRGTALVPLTLVLQVEKTGPEAENSSLGLPSYCMFGPPQLYFVFKSKESNGTYYTVDTILL